jgi:hypothetical protein
VREHRAIEGTEYCRGGKKAIEST